MASMTVRGRFPDRPIHVDICAIEWFMCSVSIWTCKGAPKFRCHHGQTSPIPANLCKYPWSGWVVCKDKFLSSDPLKENIQKKFGRYGVDRHRREFGLIFSEKMSDYSWIPIRRMLELVRDVQGWICCMHAIILQQWATIIQTKGGGSKTIKNLTNKTCVMNQQHLKFMPQATEIDDPEFSPKAADNRCLWIHDCHQVNNPNTT